MLTHSPERKVYGRHKGHKLSPRQQMLTEQLLPKVKVDINKAAPNNISELFQSKTTEIWVEVGFGGGEHLAWQAEIHPEVGLIGCEHFVNGVAKLLDAIEKKQLDNVRIHDDDARFILDWLPKSSIDKIFILFPDPWPKKKHRKRRFICKENLDKIADVMHPGAKLHIATDIADYVRTTLLALSQHKEFKWLDNGPSDWSKCSQERPLTRYEQKALEANRKPSYLTFERI